MKVELSGAPKELTEFFQSVRYRPMNLDDVADAVVGHLEDLHARSDPEPNFWR